jgi:hypothetical protein
MEACAALERVSSSAVCAFPGRVFVSVLLQSVLSPEVSGLQLHACASNARIVQQQPMLCQASYGLQQFVLHLYCLSAGACAAPGRVYLHGHLCCTSHVCLQELCAAPGVSVYKSFVVHMDASAYKSFVLHLDVSVYKSFVLHMDVSTYKSFVLHLCVTVYKSFVTHFVKQTKKQLEQIVFRFFSVQIEIFFVCFEGTLVTTIGV